MKKKYHLFCGCVLVFPMLLLISTACNPGVGDTLTGGTSNSKEYVITQNGDINYPKDSTLAVEYYTFLIDNYFNSRALYFGGLVPSGFNPDELVVSIDCTGLQYSSYDENSIQSYRLNSKDYYYVPIIVKSDKNPGDYTITARLHKRGFNAIIAKTYTLKVAQYRNQGNWGLNVYQQESYNKLDDTIDEIVSEFKNMGVEFGSNGVNIDNVKSDLPDQIVDFYHQGVPIEDDPAVQYVFNIIYPGLSTSAAINKYFDDHPYEGLLFFIKDYNPLDPGDDLLGSTVSGNYVNGLKKRAPITWIFIEQHLDVEQVWQDKYIQTTVLHELGHLWCEGFTDKETHTFWHNSDNKGHCLMKSGLTIINQVPDEAAQKVLNYREFCTGHLQRGANISWYENQYSPFGESTGGTSSPSNILLASNTGSANSLDKDLEIELTCDKAEFIQGESIDVLVKIANNTNDTIRISAPNHIIYDFGKDSTFSNPGRGIIIIPPLKSYFYMVDPSDYLLFDGLDFSTNTLKSGSYSYYTSIMLRDKEYFSNKIDIKVNQVPDTLFQAFNDLKYNPNAIPSVESAEELLDSKYKGSFYERNYFRKVLSYPQYSLSVRYNNYYKEYKVKSLELHKEFIIKYPNTSSAYLLFKRISDISQNQELVGDIITALKNNQPDCKLLQVLRNQPGYNEQIIHLLY